MHDVASILGRSLRRWARIWMSDGVGCGQPPKRWCSDAAGSRRWRMPPGCSAPGGGRKPLTSEDPSLVQDLEALVEPVTRGDPMAPLRWTCKSTRQLAAELSGHGHHVSHQTVAELLHALRYSLQGTRKTKEGASHPDRDAQFAYLNEQVQA